MILFNTDQAKTLALLFQDKFASLTGRNIKASNARELLARFVGFNSYNGLIAALKQSPVDTCTSYEYSNEFFKHVSDKFKISLDGYQQHVLTCWLERPPLELVPAITFSLPERSFEKYSEAIVNAKEFLELSNKETEDVDENSLPIEYDGYGYSEEAEADYFSELFALAHEGVDLSELSDDEHDKHYEDWYRANELQLSQVEKFFEVKRIHERKEELLENGPGIEFFAFRTDRLIKYGTEASKKMVNVIKERFGDDVVLGIWRIGHTDLEFWRGSVQPSSIPFYQSACMAVFAKGEWHYLADISGFSLTTCGPYGNTNKRDFYYMADAHTQFSCDLAKSVINHINVKGDSFDDYFFDEDNFGENTTVTLISKFNSLDDIIGFAAFLANQVTVTFYYNGVEDSDNTEADAYADLGLPWVPSARLLVTYECGPQRSNIHNIINSLHTLQIPDTDRGDMSDEEKETLARQQLFTKTLKEFTVEPLYEGEYEIMSFDPYSYPNC
ncbi:hypothetical protein [Vibrio coralliilyticus]|uniref:hypothetical protein n=1 Tax=Vibrio coralliilyticus TaxID=190893 RepID=UPI000BAC28A4|nr:hypothetical protein [Vibrio coralliilyticus]PAW02216.1 hypothetical protein CKJ79_16270 [Vibrio coralliilyticus]